MTKLVLIGDVGGTNLRFQFVAADAVPGLVPEPLLAVRHKTRDFGCLEDSLALVMQQLETAMPGAALLAAGFSVCGPITETTGGASSAICLAPAMNEGWNLCSHRLAAALAIPEEAVTMVNDFVAVGLALSRFLEGGNANVSESSLLTCLHPGVPSGRDFAVLGPGTGLGECFGIWEGDTPVVHASEGGMSDFAARTPKEWMLRQWVAEQHGVEHVEVEKLVSGTGLYR